MPSKKLTPEQREFQNHSGLKLGRRIYRGDGCIYRLDKYPNRVVKIAENHRSRFNSLGILEYIMNSKNPAIVKLYKIGSFTAIRRVEGKSVEQKYYYYVMDKLKLIPIGLRESKVSAIETALYFPENKEYIKQYERYMTSKVKTFITHARKIKYTYYDFHEWNIMQNKKGALKFIDLESFMHKG
jgi:hypothetical protein